MSEIVLEVSRELMVRIDSLLSCLRHRHGRIMDEISELDELKDLASRVRKITAPSCPVASENECNCLHMFEIDEPAWICPKHGYKRL